MLQKYSKIEISFSELCNNNYLGDWYSLQFHLSTRTVWGFFELSYPYIWNTRYVIRWSL